MWWWLILSAVSQAQGLASQAPEGPVDFRCDQGQATRQPNRWICRHNVVVRRGELWVCCERFEGYRTEAGDWNRFVCEGTVRARRGDELMWARRGTFIMATSDLILTGAPEVQRAGSLLRGERIVIDTKYDQARVENPRGRLETTNPDTVATLPPLPPGPLPARCPLPPRPTTPAPVSP